MGLEIALAIVGALIAIVAIASGITGLWLTVKYFRFNRRQNSLGLTGIEIARKILDDHGLEHIKVKRTGSLLFGNSYSHYFKKVRLRGLIRHETSLTSIGIGAQKAALAILDKEGDPDVTAGGKLIDIALGYGKEDSLLVSYEFVPGSVDENGATVAPKYIITFKNTGTDMVKIKAILTELGTTSGINFIVTDGTTETTLGKTTDEQFVEIAVSAAPEEETPEEPETPEQA